MDWMWGVRERDAGAAVCGHLRRQGDKGRRGAGGGDFCWIWVGGGTTAGVCVMPRALPPATV